MPRLIPVADPADPRVEPYLQVRERDLVGRRREFVAEGEVVLQKLVRSARHRPASLLLAEKRVEGLASLLADLPEDTPVYTATQDVLDAIVGFHIHRGVLAIGERAPEPTPEALLDALPPRALVLALFGIGNHDNIGGIFRNAAAFGADAVLLDPACADPFYRKAIRVSVGATLLTPFARLSPGRDLLELLAARGIEAVAFSPSGASALAALPRAPRMAVLLGAEGPGLPADLMARTRTVRIPMAEGFDSLNVAVTAGIALHHLACAAQVTGT
jgi:tRNA G18 (ribose-2'-O)-methylase SpoU